MRSAGSHLLLLIALQAAAVFGLEPLPPDVDAVFQRGVHAVVGCESCHWEEPDKTPRAKIPRLCGDCHPGAQADYESSVHWSGGEAHAVCTDCHGNHGILPVADPGSKAHRSMVCGQCHPGPMEELVSGPHGAAFEKTQAQLCASCHSNHAVQHPTIAGVEPQCASCHAKTTEAFAIGQRIEKQFTSFRSQQTATTAAIGRAEVEGYEVTRAAQLLTASKGQFTQARLTWHSLGENRIREDLEKASRTAKMSSDLIQEIIDGQKTREAGIVIAWAAILVAVLGLHLKRKSLET